MIGDIFPGSRIRDFFFIPDPGSGDRIQGSKSTGSLVSIRIRNILDFGFGMKVKIDKTLRSSECRINYRAPQVSSALSFIGGVHVSAKALDMVWLNRSPIPVGRRGVISSVK
jgi:hypothetical protein